MIPGMIINFLTGSGVKMLSHIITQFYELKRQKELAVLNAPTDRIKVLQEGNDTADNMTRTTRRILALALVSTWCFILIFHVVKRPDLTYTVMINKDSAWFWSFFCDSTDKTVLKISAGSLIWDFKNFIEIIAGFYFTKVGR